MPEITAPNDQFIMPSKGEFDAPVTAPEQLPKSEEAVATPQEFLGRGASIIAYRELVLEESKKAA